MKTSSLILAVAGSFLMGCAGIKSNVPLDTVGPEPGQTVSATPDTGTLIVYSAYKVNADFNAPNPNHREYSDYNILDSNKKLVKRIHNVTEGILEGAVSVELPAGKYFVDARSNGYGRVNVPVIVASGQHTVIHLDGSDSDKSAFNAANAVRLPDGEIIGWKATTGY